jgi:hypothetical protein
MGRVTPSRTAGTSSLRITRDKTEKDKEREEAKDPSSRNETRQDLKRRCRQ